MTPTYEEYKAGATQWRSNIKGVGVLLSHHGVRPEPDFITGLPHPGTWAYYILVPEQMYPHRWDDFKCIRDEHGFEQNGKAFDAVDFHGRITWASSEPYFCRKTMRHWDGVKVGCDYNHLWDADGYYSDGYDDVLHDAKISAAQFLDLNPDFHMRCAYTGVWADNAEFYQARNKAWVHQSVADRIDVSPHWKPCTDSEE